jgi:hypothetical protein
MPKKGATDRVWPEWDLFSRDRLFQVKAGLVLPLERRGFLTGETAFGRSAVRHLPVDEGVLTSRQGIVALHSHDLTRELWRVEVPDWLDRIICEGDTALVGADRQAEILRIDFRTGAIAARAKTPEKSVIVGFTAKTLLVLAPLGRASGELVAIDRESFAPIWKHTALSPQNTSFGERYLIQDKLATILRCLDAGTGEVLWHVDLSESRFWEKRQAPPPEPLKIVQGYPSVVVVGDRVLVVLNDARVCVLDPESGEVLDIVRTGIEAPRGVVRPMHLITDTSIFYLHAFGMVEFDHRSMKEASRIEFRKEVEPHYAKVRGIPYPCAFWLSAESVIWTNLSGLLIGISREPGKDGSRTVWADWMPGALVPIAQFPLAFGEYIYFSEYGEKKVGLHCYRGRRPPGQPSGLPSRSSTS